MQNFTIDPLKHVPAISLENGVLWLVSSIEMVIGNVVLDD